MTNEEAKKMLKAKVECFKNETSGINHDCNMRLCDGCSLNYEQGNMGEQKEALDMAIKALEQTELNLSYNSVKTELEQTRWIPVKWHIKTEEDEYERYPDGVVMIDSPMPEDGQEILITIKSKSGYYWVEKTIACCDDGDGWYTDDGYDWGDDIIAWMPLPKPYKEGDTDDNMDASNNG